MKLKLKNYLLTLIFCWCCLWFWQFIQREKHDDYSFKFSLFHRKDETFHILFLVKKAVYESEMDRWFENIVQVTRNHTRFHFVDVWGVGWPSWNDSLSVTFLCPIPIFLVELTFLFQNNQPGANILARYGNQRIDVVFSHELHPPPGVERQWIRSSFMRDLRCDLGLSHCEAPLFLKNLDVMYFAYANQAPFLLPYIKNRLIVHQPDSAPKYQFYHSPEATRTIDVLMVGKVGDLYPIRKNVLQWTQEGKLRVVYRRHPGRSNKNHTFYFVAQCCDKLLC